MRVVVLMSTYQGEKFVGEQLASVLAQLPPEGRIVIRDDGSTDDTLRSIEAIGDPRVSIVRGANLGFVRSFFTLMDSAPADAEMLMLCDQDDVWLPDRIERAWRAIRSAGATPALYCSRLQLVDPTLQPLGLSPDWRCPPSFENALAENIVTGCTSAFNPAALHLIRMHGDPSLVHFHDWWMYLVVSAFGTIIYDPKPTVLYRQHGGNAIGMGAGLARYLAIIRFLRKTNWIHIMFRQIENFRTTHGMRLAHAQRDLLDGFFDPDHVGSVARLIFARRRFRQSMIGELLFRLLLVANIASGRGLIPRE